MYLQKQLIFYSYQKKHRRLSLETQVYFLIIFENNFVLIQIHSLEILIFLDILSNKAFKYLVWESSIKKFEAFRYSLIIILVEIFGLNKKDKPKDKTIINFEIFTYFKDLEDKFEDSGDEFYKRATIGVRTTIPLILNM